MIRDAIAYRIRQRTSASPEHLAEVVPALSADDVEQALSRVERYGASPAPSSPQRPFARRQGLWPR
jgi:hypothetical protein